MIIAVTSQNTRTITGHAGRCRRFWLYDAADSAIRGKRLVEIGREETYHEGGGRDGHPVDRADVLITGGAGAGLIQRMRKRGISLVVTEMADPDDAVARFLEGRLESAQTGCSANALDDTQEPSAHDGCRHEGPEIHPEGGPSA